MSKQIRKLGPQLLLICGFVSWLVALGVVTASAPPRSDGSPPARKPAPLQNPAQSPPATPQTGQATYIKEEEGCIGNCHYEQKPGYYNSAHHRAADPRTPVAKNSCQTCHGPGSQHIEDPVLFPVKDFTKLPPAEVNATCVTCHNRGEHALWEGSQHESRGLACTSCHSVHAYKSETKQLKAKTQPELCVSCHRDKVAKLDRSGHMPVREGKLECTSCHNVHGTTNVKLLRKGDSIAELCTSCHAEKRGPFLWEHAPSRDGCVSCHDAHGSSNERMLVAKPPLLCQRCHVGTRHPSTIYDALLVGAGSNPSIRVYARTCVSCHSAIHGSNHPSGQRFVR